MIVKYALAYVATGLVFGLLDFLWLTRVGPGLYKPILGDLLADAPRVGPAIAFYLLFIAGILVFATAPAFASGRWIDALVKGALFGFFAYATYDLTNHATLRIWATKITLLDMAWGTFVTGAAAAGGYVMTRAILGRV